MEGFLTHLKLAFDDPALASRPVEEIIAAHLTGLYSKLSTRPTRRVTAAEYCEHVYDVDRLMADCAGSPRLQQIVVTYMFERATAFHTKYPHLKR